MIDLCLGIAFLVFVALGLLFDVNGFSPTAVIFGTLGVILIIIYWIARRRGYSPPMLFATSYAELKIAKEQIGSPTLRVVVRSGGIADQVHIFIGGKEEVSTSWTFGRKKAYDLIVGGKKLRVELRRGVGGSRYEFYSDGNLLAEGRLESSL
jgi:hypothetical protein